MGDRVSRTTIGGSAPVQACGKGIAFAAAFRVCDLATRIQATTDDWLSRANTTSLRRRGIAHGAPGCELHTDETRPTNGWWILLLLLLVPGILTGCGSPGENGNSAPTVGVNATRGPAEGGLAATEATAARAGADPGAATAATGRKLKVVATFSVLGDLVRNVGGDLIELTTLVPPGGDAHTFEPSPADGVALAEAEVVFENGLQFEAWLPDLFAASGSKARRVVLSEGIELLKAPEGEDDERADETAMAGVDRQAEGTTTVGTDEHGAWDPHVWHDVNNAVRMVEHIRDGLAAVDPANAATYRGNAGSYLQQIKALDAFVVERANTLPPERRKLVTTHDTFGYFARRYGFEIVGTPLGVTTEAADPSAAEIAALVNQIKATGVLAIFTENIENSRLMQRIAREAGVELAPPLYTDALGEQESDGDTYEKMIRYNIETIVQALGK